MMWMLTWWCLLGPGASAADLSLHGSFGEHMVLQQGASVPVFGLGPPGSTVVVGLQGQTHRSEVLPDGTWRVALDPLQIGGPWQLDVALDPPVGPSDTLVVADVMVGEVWLCGGQSNMTRSVGWADGGDRALRRATDPHLRLYTVPQRSVSEPQREVLGAWVRATPESVEPFSAVCYYMAQALREALGAPVGVIHASIPGTRAAAWTPREALTGHPMLDEVLEQWNDEVAAYPAKQAAYLADHRAWVSIRAGGAGQSEMPKPPKGPGSTRQPSGAWNGMVAPLVKTQLAGVVWYQGESNHWRPDRFAYTGASLVDGWRAAWEQPRLPMLVVELAPTGAPAAYQADSRWAPLRLSQQRIAGARPDTELVGTVDLGDEGSVHPPSKAPLGLRLAAAAQALVYEGGAEWTGPQLVAVERHKGGLMLSYGHASEGLAVRGEELTGFWVAGRDGVFQPAQAQLRGEGVFVWREGLPKPQALRYDFADYPTGTLQNGAGFRASPAEWPESR